MNKKSKFPGNLKMSLGLSNIKDIDQEILLEIEDDNDLIQMCKLNTYLHSLCNDHFWERRFKKFYPGPMEAKDQKSWKQLYFEKRKAPKIIPIPQVYLINIPRIGSSKIPLTVIKSEHVKKGDILVSSSNSFITAFVTNVTDSEIIVEPIAIGSYKQRLGAKERFFQFGFPEALFAIGLDKYSDFINSITKKGDHISIIKMKPKNERSEHMESYIRE